jgi:AcrR family transcriptional regulator
VITPQERAPEVRGKGGRLPRDARRSQLLGAAREVFVAQGYHAAAMDEIADRAGVSKPVLYQHFPGKRELYIALVDKHAAELLVTCVRAMASSTNNKARVQSAIDALFDFVDEDGESFRLIFESDLTNDDDVRARVEGVENQIAAAIAAVISEDTGLPEAEAMLVGVGLVGVAHVTARFWLATGRKIPRAQAAALVTQLSWRGIRGFPRADGAPAAAPGSSVG